MSRVRTTFAAMGLALGLASGCGHDAPVVSGPVAVELQAHIDNLRAAAAAGDGAAAAQRLADLRAAVEQGRASGALTPFGADAVLEAADAVEDQLHLIAPPPTTATPAPTTAATAPPPETTTPAPAPAGGGEGEGDKGKGKGKGKDDD